MRIRIIKKHKGDNMWWNFFIMEAFNVDVADGCRDPYVNRIERLRIIHKLPRLASFTEFVIHQGYYEVIQSIQRGKRQIRKL